MNNLKTLLLNLPWKSNGRLGVRAGSRWPFTSLPEADGQIHYIPFPFFLAYSAALLKKNRKNALLIDAIAEGLDIELLLKRIASYQPKLIIIETATASFKNDIDIIKRIKIERQDIDIALCGPHASACKEQIMAQYPVIEYILEGEYEQIILELVEALEQNKELVSIKGLMFRGQLNFDSKRSGVCYLDDLPWPERKDVPIYKYNDGFAGMPVPCAQMWSSRGCPFSCIFCLWPQTMYRRNEYRRRDPLDVVDEMEYLVKGLNFKAVYFDDCVFNADKAHVEAICRQIIKRKLNAPWAVMARPDLMDEEIIKKMAEAGLCAVKYGIESADENILKLCRKDLNLLKAESIIKKTMQMGIKTHLTFCLGLPGETLATVQKTLQFIKALKPDSHQISIATPFPGTEYFFMAKENNWLRGEELSDYDGNCKSMARTQALSWQDIERIKIDFSNNLNS